MVIFVSRNVDVHRVFPRNRRHGITSLTQHYALERAGIESKVVMTIDLNPVCNEVYEYNFGIKPLQKQVESLSAEFINKFKANCWLMSPPCQPYTRTSRQLDTKDNRVTGLLYLINLLPQSTPKYLFLENVVGFEKSESRDLLVEKLVGLGFEFTEWIITPSQLGIPNNRPRYYLTAVRVNDIDWTRRIPQQAVVLDWTRKPIFELGSLNVQDFVDYDLQDASLQIPAKILSSKKRIDSQMICKPKDTNTKCLNGH